MTATAAEPTRPAAGVMRFARYIFEITGRRAIVAILLLLVGSVTEGGSILLLIPVLQLGALKGETITLHPPAGLAADLLGQTVQFGLIPALVALVALVLAQVLFAGL